MTILWYAKILVAFVCFVFLLHWRRNRHQAIINWPVVGMLPALLRSASHVHDSVTRVLKNQGGTFEFKGPWFTNMNFLVTCDPININHTLSRNFSNYEKGPKFREIFDPLGDGILNSDSDWWRYQRKLIQSMFSDKKFKLFLEKVLRVKVESSLVPVLDHISSTGIEVDLQDVFHRYTFDIVCLLVLGFDSKCLSIEFPEVAYAKAFDQMEQSIFYRHIVPESYWKLQRWLQIGEEKKLSNARKIFDRFLYRCISSKREKLSRSRTQKMEEDNFDLLTACMEQEAGGEIDSFAKSDNFVRDMALALVAAGRDSVTAGLSWFLWLVATHPLVEAKLLEEIREHLLVNNEIRWDIDELSKLLYLHGAVCESLRLFPPVPFQHKHAIQADILPSGHHVRPGMRILYPLYSTGRMESIWGGDCLDFKPERWISEQGTIIHAPSYKFITFNSGPRTCPGKDMSLLQMKIVATSIISNYRVQVVEGHPVLPNTSIVLLMKHGLNVRIIKRDL